MTEIIEEVLKHLPHEKIAEANFEGANIILYTKDKKFFLEGQEQVKEVVHTVKKRIELRPDSSLCLKQEIAEEKIRAIIGEEAGVDQVIFDPQRSTVIIEVEKPGAAIGKNGELLHTIRAETLWVPEIRRMPAIRSQLIENIRAVLYQNSDYRRKFLHQAGERIYSGWTRGRKESWVRVTYLGSGRQVGRSCILLQTPESRVLLDLGMDPAFEIGEPGASPHLEAPEFDINELDAVIISHAHLDHCALVPYLFKFGYRGPVYCTPPTRDVMALLQLDFVKIMRSEGKEPLYSADDIKEMVKHTITLNLEEVTDITPDIRVTLYNAGHIIGSAMVHLHIGNGLYNILYTGDMKFAKTNMLSPAISKFPRLETVMIESTYGGKDNVLPPLKEQDEIFAASIIRTFERKGKVLVPVLGVGRAQEVIVFIERLIREGKLPKVPIYIDGMVWDVTAIHTAYPEYLNSDVRAQIFQRDNNPFLADNLKRVGSAEERRQVIEEEGSCVILATSGMLVGGPSVEYLKGLCESPLNTLIFSCYQAAGSLGNRIQQGIRDFNAQRGTKIDTYEVKMEVEKLEITGHSDRKELMAFVQQLMPRPRKILINHGEQSRGLDLARSIHQQFRIETMCPRNLDAVRLR